MTSWNLKLELEHNFMEFEVGMNSNFVVGFEVGIKFKGFVWNSKLKWNLKTTEMDSEHSCLTHLSIPAIAAYCRQLKKSLLVTLGSAPASSRSSEVSTLFSRQARWSAVSPSTSFQNKDQKGTR